AIAGVTYVVDGLEVTFDATVSGTAPIAFAWDFGDGNTSDVEDPVHVYEAGGDYTVTLIVSNDCGEDTWTGEVTVCDPVSGLDFSWLPAMPAVNDEILFTATAMGTPPITFAWDFGDGTTGAGITATHAYTMAGDYVVTLTATNCDGTGSAVITDTVTVAEAPVTMWRVFLPVVMKGYLP
ncbi:MAG TPA: PKD domain-containing protein, partial [Anaerolineae bacterium]|nr:PKD domain-containing protein [Anaerolineae bacterium]